MAASDLTAKDIRIRRDKAPEQRDRDFAEAQGISEAALVAAYCGRGVTRIDAHPDTVMGAAQELGEVMALTRNLSCVHEKIGVYDNYHPGAHAAMILTEEIDLRIFPGHWHHAFLVERAGEAGVRRSLQVFDAAGDAVHKVILREGSDHAAFAGLVGRMASEDQSPEAVFKPRQPAEAPRIAPDKVEILRKEWTRMTDTHQFLRLVSKLKMNRLGAYRAAGLPFARRLDTGAVEALLRALQRSETEVMLFVGNRGCIQIHTGAIHTLKPMGPWQNVMDPGFNLHLRGDHVAEVWAVDKPTQRGTATSVEAFDAQGALIFQIFGVPKEGRDSRPAFRAIVQDLQEVVA
ncbi:hemin-degrading factor [Roseobacter cerasinus]|uniref:Hemin-degrading factor n=1 Tax=Roseobacter cerasinus TaxID=2602289 RepID=A0A640VUV4_9RHOB|nr:ChuX/HutX family heme-like substrate-binding protein [Roseobacter cerasinus]GFE51933.1 hemin-degrading factor [Roseobacter cerasinus]